MQDKASFAYTNVQISTIDRGRLLLMMYDGAIKFLTHAKVGLEAGDIMKFARFLSKGQAIIAELMNTLDFEKGGKIAKDLSRLYDFMLFYLTEANLHKDPKKIQRVISLLETIAGAYREIILVRKAGNEVPVEAPRQAVAPTPAKQPETPIGKYVRVSL